MECSECGFDSPPGMTRCAKCGRLLAPHVGESPVPPQETFSASSLASGTAKAKVASASSTASQERAGPELSSAVAPRKAPEKLEVGVITNLLTRPQQAWQEELSERVDDYRRRRSRLKGAQEQNPNLDFDFEALEKEKPGSGTAAPESEQKVDLASAAETTLHPEAKEPSKGSIDWAENKTAAKGLPFAEEVLLEHETAAAEPLEIALGASSIATSTNVLDAGEPRLAPLGPRFLAGIVDGIVLLLAGGVFALVFWLVGGHASPNLINEFAMGFIGVFLFLVYFGMFTVLTSSTPGLSLMGLEVRNVQGHYPTKEEAYWRAFGCLVSASALMLGFVWAVFDSDGLTWHDRMSGTFVSAPKI